MNSWSGAYSVAFCHEKVGPDECGCAPTCQAATLLGTFSRFLAWVHHPCRQLESYESMLRYQRRKHSFCGRSMLIPRSHRTSAFSCADCFKEYWYRPIPAVHRFRNRIRKPSPAVSGRIGLRWRRCLMTSILMKLRSFGSRQSCGIPRLSPMPDQGFQTPRLSRSC